MKAWLAVVALVGCGSELPARRPQAHAERRTPPVLAPAPTPEPIGTTLAAGDPRPEVRAAIEIDAASIPVGKWGPPLAHSQFRMTANPPSFQIEGSQVGEVSVGGFSAFTDTATPTADWPQCQRSGSATALWRGFSLDTWSDDGLEVIMSRGPFDFASCTARPTASLVKSALGIVPGFVYALRVDDSLYLVLPHSQFASATRNAAGSGPFSSATLPCRPHHESAAAMRIGPSALRTWQAITTDGSRIESTGPLGEQGDSLLVVVEVRARGEGNVVSISAAPPQTTSEDEYAPFFSAMRRGSRGT